MENQSKKNNILEPLIKDNDTYSKNSETSELNLYSRVESRLSYQDPVNLRNSSFVNTSNQNNKIEVEDGKIRRW